MQKQINVIFKCIVKFIMRSGCHFIMWKCITAIYLFLADLIIEIKTKKYKKKIKIKEKE